MEREPQPNVELGRGGGVLASPISRRSREIAKGQDGLLCKRGAATQRGLRARMARKGDHAKAWRETGVSRVGARGRRPLHALLRVTAPLRSRASRAILSSDEPPQFRVGHAKLRGES